MALVRSVHALAKKSKPYWDRVVMPVHVHVFVLNSLSPSTVCVYLCAKTGQSGPSMKSLGRPKVTDKVKQGMKPSSRHPLFLCVCGSQPNSDIEHSLVHVSFAT